MNLNPKPAFVFGGFDNIHSADIRHLDEASKLGPLTVFLWSDDLIRRQTGNAPKFPENERAYFLRAIRYVSDVKLIADEAAKSTLYASPEACSGTWVLRESENPDLKDFFTGQNLPCKILRDEELRRFPEPPMPADSTRKKVLVTGCYDWLHSGHVRFFEECASYGDLYVCLGHDANIRFLKGEGRPLFPQEERRYLVGSIRYVTQALISTGDGWLDAEPEIRRLKPAIYAVNEDGDRPEKSEYCAKHGIEYLVLKRTPAPGLPKRSSTDLRNAR